MAVHVGGGNAHVASSFDYFRKAVKASYGNFTSYKYIEEDAAWFVYTELSPEVVLTYLFEKGSAEETVFLAEKSSVDLWSARKRIDIIYEPHTHNDYEDAIDDIQVALDGYCTVETSQAQDERITIIQGSLDGYCTVETSQAQDERITIIQGSLDGYCTTETCEEQDVRITDIQNELDGYCTTETCEEQDDRITIIQNSLDGYCTTFEDDDQDEQITNIQNALDGYFTNYLYEASEAESTTTSTSYQTKVTLSTGILDGTYLVFWTAVVYGDKNVLHRARLYNDTDNISLCDAAIESDFTNAEPKTSSFVKLGFQNESKDLKIQWKKGSGGAPKESKISQARIVMWRVDND